MLGKGETTLNKLGEYIKYWMDNGIDKVITNVEGITIIAIKDASSKKHRKM